jgi:hypothetical protein
LGGRAGETERKTEEEKISGVAPGWLLFCCSKGKKKTKEERKDEKKTKRKQTEESVEEKSKGSRKRKMLVKAKGGARQRKGY